MILWGKEQALHSNCTDLQRRKLFCLIKKLELNISVDSCRRRKVNSRGRNSRIKNTVPGCGSSLIWPLTRPSRLLYVSGQRKVAGDYYGTGEKGTMGRWKGKGSLFPLSHHPPHFPSPRFARANINRSLRDDWRHFLVSREPSDEVLDSKGCVFIRQIEVCKRLCFLLAKLARP